MTNYVTYLKENKPQIKSELLSELSDLTSHIHNTTGFKDLTIDEFISQITPIIQSYDNSVEMVTCDDVKEQKNELANRMRILFEFQILTYDNNKFMLPMYIDLIDKIKLN